MWLILQQVTGDSINKGAGIDMPLNMKHGLFALCEQTIVYIIHIQMFIFRRPIWRYNPGIKWCRDK